MDDLDKYIKDAEETVNQVRKTIAEYEASGDALDNLRRQADREIGRFEKLRKDDKISLEDAVDLFMEANEYKLAVGQCVDEIDDAVEDLLMAGMDELENFDPSDIDSYPPDLRDEFDALSEDDQKKTLEEFAEAEKDAAAGANAKHKAQRKRMSV